ncbi:hypothetical protein H4Q26_012220 [Puccinia striiformis f. sp. tritici PST-130]|nr:hypothetical protein H4Q26_012220 [Puccinia striiformis f. sp. tritici PST-130]
MSYVQDSSACISELNGLLHQLTPGQYMGSRREEDERASYDQLGGCEAHKEEAPRLHNRSVCDDI